MSPEVILMDVFIYLILLYLYSDLCIIAVGLSPSVDVTSSEYF